MSNQMFGVAGLLLALMLVVAACSGTPGQKIADNVTIWRDPDRNVTCWLTVQTNNAPGGISCLPDSQITNR